MKIVFKNKDKVTKMRTFYSEAIAAVEKYSFLVIPKILLPQSKYVGSYGSECETFFNFTSPFLQLNGH